LYVGATGDRPSGRALARIVRPLFSRERAHGRHAEGVESGTSSSADLPAGHDERAGPLVATPRRVQCLGRPDQRLVGSGQQRMRPPPLS
jgi:hypothetical protein